MIRYKDYVESCAAPYNGDNLQYNSQGSYIVLCYFDNVMVKNVHSYHLFVMLKDLYDEERKSNGN